MDMIILARHGESEFSVRAAMNGDPRVSGPLTALGREQARALGEALAQDAIDLVVVTEFERTRETAELAVGSRGIPLLVVPELNDPRYGVYEGAALADYHAWASAYGPLDEPDGRGESRANIVRRYVAGLRAVRERPERTVLVVAHALPIRYVLEANAGRLPTAVVELVEYATPHRLTADELDAALERLESWCAAPAF